MILVRFTITWISSVACEYTHALDEKSSLEEQENQVLHKPVLRSSVAINCEWEEPHVQDDLVLLFGVSMNVRFLVRFPLVRCFFWCGGLRFWYR